MSAINFEKDGDTYEVWLDTEESTDMDGGFHDGTIIGSGATFEDAREEAIATLRQHITELETKADPALSQNDDDEDEEEGEDDDGE